MTIYFVVDEERFYGVFAKESDADYMALKHGAWVVPLRARKPGVVP